MIAKFKQYIIPEIDEQDVILINSQNEQGYHLEYDLYQVLEPLFQNYQDINTLSFNGYDPLSVKEVLNMFKDEGLLEERER